MEYLNKLNEKPLPREDWLLHVNTPLFKEAVDKIIKEENVSCIIECGTNIGIGSTTVFAETGKKVLTCEGFKFHFEKAKENLKNFKNVKIYNEFTTDKNDGDPVWLNSLKEKGISPKRSNWLERTLKKEHEKVKEGESMLFFLDSHWTMGFIEFRKIFDFWFSGKAKINLIVVLDDCTNLKHRPTIRFLETHPELGIEYVEKERWGVIKLKK